MLKIDKISKISDSFFATKFELCLILFSILQTICNHLCNCNFLLQFCFLLQSQINKYEMKNTKFLTFLFNFSSSFIEILFLTNGTNHFAFKYILMQIGYFETIFQYKLVKKNTNVSIDFRFYHNQIYSLHI